MTKSSLFLSDYFLFNCSKWKGSHLLITITVQFYHLPIRYERIIFHLAFIIRLSLWIQIGHSRENSPLHFYFYQEYLSLSMNLRLFYLQSLLDFPHLRRCFLFKSESFDIALLHRATTFLGQSRNLLNLFYW